MWCGLIKSIAIRCLVSYPTLLNPTNFDDAVYTYLGGVWEWELTIKVYNDHKPQIKKKKKKKNWQKWYFIHSVVLKQPDKYVGNTLMFTIAKSSSYQRRGDVFF